MTQSSRRRFLQSSAAGAALASAAAGQAQRPVPANNKLQTALIGCGGMGHADLQSSLATGQVQVVAAADVYQGRLDAMKEQYGAQVFTTRDYREVLARPDIDFVIVATPDHWHQKIAIDAMNAGKDVYVEKPMVQQVSEGRALVEAQARTKRVLQVGSQRVSSVVYAKAGELVRAGSIGTFNMIEAWWDRNSALGAWQYSIPPGAAPENIDWDRFLGAAPKRPFEPVRLFRWRNYRDYGTGVTGDLFVHLFSGMHAITGALGPTRVYATGGLRYWKDGRDVPDVMLGLFDYPETKNHPAFNLILRVNFVDGSGGGHTFRFIGDEGVLTVNPGDVTLARQPKESEPGYTIGTFAQATQEKFLAEYRKKYPPQRVTAAAMRPRTMERYPQPPGYSDHRHHHEIFVNAVRSRQPVVEDAAFGFRAAGPALLCNQSYFDKKIVHWDPVKMETVG
ncbi:MAG: Gfo/Idh/MocA family oxidoreductase [Bryobacterales bacterium]|nr:Gfo/Idh/MocA family oxidoreductase [Bryobacterales bacterium]